MEKAKIESLLKQFEIVEQSIHRAKLPFETEMLHPKIIEVTLYELIKSYHQIANLVREIDPERFAARTISATHIPELNAERLHLCTICGNPDCQSDHK